LLEWLMTQAVLHPGVAASVISPGPPERGATMSRHTDTGTIAFDPADRPLGVVVGFDGSANSQLALRYGARAAQRRGSTLTVVTSFTVSPAVYTTLAAVPRVPDEELKQKATQEAL